MTLLMVAITLSLAGQSTALVDKNSSNSSVYYYQFYQLDTVSTSSSTHTFQMSPAVTFARDMDCVVAIQADSLSGGTTATATIQGLTHPGSTAWHTVGTAVTIDGVSTASRQTFQMLESRIRLNVAAGSSTQSTKITFELGCKAR